MFHLLLIPLAHHAAKHLSRHAAHTAARHAVHQSAKHVVRSGITSVNGYVRNGSVVKGAARTVADSTKFNNTGTLAKLFGFTRKS